MKVLVESEQNEGFEALAGEQIMVFCPNYIYAGKLVGINKEDIKLEDPKIVYETGSFNDPGYKDAQRLPGKYHYIRTALIESYGKGK